MASIEPSLRNRRVGLTLVEMLVAMALTLLMMAAVVSIFANVSTSVTHRRATIEMSGQVRHVRGVLQRDLAGATCPGVTWQRQDSNHGYIEVIEGPHCDFDPSIWLRDTDTNGVPDPVDSEQLLLDESTLPSSNLKILPGSDTNTTIANSKTDGGGLGDWDDVLMLTVRNESEPFKGRVPNTASLTGTNSFGFADNNLWSAENIESTLAEVVWFAVENPVEVDGISTFALGEPGFRTIYRRALLIAPHLNYRFQIPGAAGNKITGPGVVRVLGDNIDRLDGDDVRQAIASLIAFQERYDLSVRLAWNPTLGVDGRWTIVANSLADLTKRENRYEHFGPVFNSSRSRQFPFTAISAGSNIMAGDGVSLVLDPELDSALSPTPPGGEVAAEVGRAGTALKLTSLGIDYLSRPYAYVASSTNAPMTARAIRDESNRIVAFTTGLAPLGGARRGEDIMLTGALAFDLRVYDPKAPLLAEINNVSDSNFPGSVVTPGELGWGHIYERDDVRSIVVGRGAYVDLGYYSLHRNFFNLNAGLPNWPNVSDAQVARFLDFSILAGRQNSKSQLGPSDPTDTADPGRFEPFRTYDTWSFHYENNGVNEDGDVSIPPFATQPARGGNPLTDEGTNGLDDPDPTISGAPSRVDPTDFATLGPDDFGERETSPPYDTRLRGVQAALRVYELDSKQIREVKVSQTFVPK